MLNALTVTTTHCNSLHPSDEGGAKQMLDTVKLLVIKG